VQLDPVGARAPGRLVRIAVAAGGLLAFALAPARADDRVDFTTTWFQEKRAGGLGGLSVIHPQLDVEIDAGETASFSTGYAADVVTGATAKVYSVDAVSSATTFDDIRHVGKLAIGFGGSRSRLSFHGTVGSESDYHSISAGASGDIDLPGKNTNIALSYSHNFDEVCTRDNATATIFERRTLDSSDDCKTRRGLFGKDDLGVTLWRDVSIDTSQATVTQNLSPTTVGQISLFGQIVRGYQANPYRAVRVRSVEALENMPDVRARAAITARVNRYLPGLRGAIHASLRGYSDTWGVNSGTAELGYSQYAGGNLLLHFRARIYQQSEAEFFKDAFFYQTEGEAGAYFTGDRELGRLRHIIAGGKLSYIKVDSEGDSFFEEIRLNLKGDILLFDELAVDPIELNPEGIDRQFLSSGQFFDGFVLQLGLLLRY
jgi:hypothetical protein